MATKQRTPRFRSVDSHSVAGGGPELTELIKLPTPVWLTIYVVTFPFKHRIFGLTLAVTLLTLFMQQQVSFWTILVNWLVGISLATIALYAYTYARYRHGPTIPRLTRAILRRWAVRRRWVDSMHALGFRPRVGPLRRLRHVQYTPNGLVGDLVCDQGKTAFDLQKAAQDLAAMLHANEVKVDVKLPHIARVSIIWGDPTQRVLFPEDINGYQSPNRETVVFALDSDHAPLTISITTSILVVGESEAGKSNCFWSILNALNESNIPYKLWVIDPAGGVELDALEHGPNTLAYVQSPSESEGLANQALDAMNERLRSIKDRGARKYDISEAEPLNVVIVDELLLLPNYNQYSSLGQILSTGRKAGFIVIGLSQLSQIDALGRTRDLFPQRICHATKSPDMTDAALGVGAEAAGAHCSQISKKTPGVGYFYSLEIRHYIRFRTPFISDHNTRVIAQGNLIQRTITNDIIKPKTKRLLAIRKTAVYRYYGEYRGELGRLLYVGISYNPKTRWQQHCEDPTKPWCPQDVDPSLTEIEWHPSRREAKAAETQAIKEEYPIYNKMERNDYGR